MAEAARWLTHNARRRAAHERFACLEDCGFCCTYPPQVDEALWKRLERTAALQRIAVDEAGTLRLPLQGTCGACVLLAERKCTAYDDRPRHCRAFPFHVYFGRVVEVYANRVCPGLDPIGEASTLPLSEAIDHALAGVTEQELEARATEARGVHREFERRARDAGVWAEVARARARALDALDVTPAAWGEAMGPFQSPRKELLPTMVLERPGFEWRMWRARKDGSIERLRLHEDGAVERAGAALGPVSPPPAVDAPVRSVVRRLIGYECAVGAAFDLVDASAYRMPVDDAFRRVADLAAAALSLRAQLLEAEGLDADERWLAAAYEPEFYDLPTIGGWL